VSFVWKLQDRGRVEFDKNSTRKPEENNIMTGEISTVALPSGTVTFLFTDIEGSTRQLRQLGEGYADLLTEQRRIVRGGTVSFHFADGGYYVFFLAG